MNDLELTELHTISQVALNAHMILATVQDADETRKQLELLGRNVANDLIRLLSTRPSLQHLVPEVLQSEQLLERTDLQQ